LPTRAGLSRVVGRWPSLTERGSGPALRRTVVLRPREGVLEKVSDGRGVRARTYESGPCHPYCWVFRRRRDRPHLNLDAAGALGRCALGALEGRITLDYKPTGPRAARSARPAVKPRSRSNAVGTAWLSTQRMYECSEPNNRPSGKPFLPIDIAEELSLVDRLRDRDSEHECLRQLCILG
jgi:hypothetical protein